MFDIYKDLWDISNKRTFVLSSCILMTNMEEQTFCNCEIMSKNHAWHSPHVYWLSKKLGEKTKCFHGCPVNWGHPSSETLRKGTKWDVSLNLAPMASFDMEPLNIIGYPSKEMKGYGIFGSQPSKLLHFKISTGCISALHLVSHLALIWHSSKVFVRKNWTRMVNGESPIINALYWPSIINYQLLTAHSVLYWPSTQLHHLVTRSWANWI